MWVGLLGLKKTESCVDLVALKRRFEGRMRMIWLMLLCVVVVCVVMDGQPMVPIPEFFRVFSALYIV
jgi:hypothetical protein